ncbi:MAG TPA: iron-sulfur cluster assembly protein [Dinghuibacter sp.]|jgi:FeS assembly SUF system protein|uniref:metal-sulfur cluster assembly factor n=1 Tax=Dinghuibacter sp. TaxID=2024697 RepID=UPI002C189964|nr:iron-sulfur cluster assembly protein [Dinghuibacter sp.]HTJ10618.1 iron-sulfur cluster assembly protein [Dinghuibacter sp.]
MSITREQVEDVLRTVFDPEIPVNVYDLGLVYGIDLDGNNVKVTMTLTAPACPAAPEILFDAESKIRAIEGVGDVHMNLTFDPPWSKEMMSEEARLELGFL